MKHKQVAATEALKDNHDKETQTDKEEGKNEGP